MKISRDRVVTSSDKVGMTLGRGTIGTKEHRDRSYLVGMSTIIQVLR